MSIFGKNYSFGRSFGKKDKENLKSWGYEEGDMSATPDESAKSDPETAEEPPLFYSAPKSDRDVEMDFMQGREVTDPDKDMMLEDGDWQLDTEEDEDTKKDTKPKGSGDGDKDKNSRVDKHYEEFKFDPKEFDKRATELDKELKQKIGEAYGVYQTSKDEVASKEMWEGIIHGIAHLAAGLVGHQTGLNLGGLKFDKKDWDRRRDQIARELESSKADAYRQMDAKQRANAERRAGAMRNFQIRQAELDEAHRKARLEHDKKVLNQRELSQKRKAFVDALRIQNKGGADYKKLNPFMTDVDQALFQYSKKESDENLAAVQAKMSRANAMARENGIPEPYNINEILKEEPGKLFGTNDPSAETISNRLSDYWSSLGGGDQPQQQLSQEDMEALQWANENPDDPRAAQIKQRLGR